MAHKLVLNIRTAVVPVSVAGRCFLEFADVPDSWSLVSAKLSLVGRPKKEAFPGHVSWMQPREELMQTVQIATVWDASNERANDTAKKA